LENVLPLSSGLNNILSKKQVASRVICKLKNMFDKANKETQREINGSIGNLDKRK
jgi:hypothetical protein